MEKIELNFEEALEGIINLTDYLLALEGKPSSTFCEDIEPLPEDEKNIIEEIRTNLDSIR